MKPRWLGEPAGVSRRAALAACGGLMVTACQRSGKKRVAMVPKGTAHLFWVAVQAGAQKAAKEFDLEILWNGPPQETDYSRQIQIIDSMIAQHVDALAVAATDAKAISAPVERAMAAGIPTVIFDSGVETMRYDSFVATDNYEAGQIGARELARLLNNEGPIAVMMNLPGSRSTADREKGFHDTVAKEFPKLKIVAEQFGMADRAKALSATENILSAHPELKGIFASSEPSAVGVGLALKARKLGGQVRFVSVDAADPMVEDLKAGIIDTLVVQDPFTLGYETVKALNQRLHGQSVEKQINLHARVVTKADLDKPDVMRLLKPVPRG